MTQQEILNKYKDKEAQLDQEIKAKSSDPIAHNLSKMYKDIINNFIKDLEQMQSSPTVSDFKCDYLVIKDIESIPLCKVHAYCDPRCCKDREIGGINLSVIDDTKIGGTNFGF